MTVRQRTLLLVEDDADDAELALRVLSRLAPGVRAVHAADGPAAVEAVLGGAVRPSLVLLDLHLPALDGFGVLRRIRADERGRWVPVVVFSASQAPEDVRRAYELGASGFARKPSASADRAGALRKVVEYWLDLNELPEEGS